MRLEAVNWNGKTRSKKMQMQAQMPAQKHAQRDRALKKHFPVLIDKRK
jgi:hypothetical protein